MDTEESKETFRWSSDLIEKLIDLRYETVKKLKADGKDLTARRLWFDIPEKLGLGDQIRPEQASQKWSNLLRKFKEIENKLENNTCTAEELSWPYYSRIQAILEVQSTLEKAPEESEADILQLAMDEISSDVESAPRRKISTIWNYFRKLDNKRAECNFCKKNFSHRSSSTNLKTHLVKIHPKVPLGSQHPVTKEMVDISGGDANNGDENDHDEDVADPDYQQEKLKADIIPEPRPFKVRRKRSIIWNFFTILDNSYAQCNICKDTFSYKTSVSNLRSHRRSRHPEAGTKITLGNNKKKKHRRKRSDASSSDYTPDREQSSGNPSEINEVHPEAGENTGGDTPEKCQEANNEVFSDSSDDDDELDMDTSGQEVPQITPDIRRSQRKKTSYLWNFFTRVDENFAECNVCKQRLVYKSGLSNLSQHQRIKHPLINFLATNPEESGMTENDNAVNSINQPSIVVEETSSFQNHPSIVISEVKKSRKYSYVWNFFTYIDENFAQCHVCNKKLSYKTSASNLMKHRQSKHPNEPIFRIINENGVQVIEDQEAYASKYGVKTSKERGRYSDVWNFFTILDTVYAECNACKKKLSHKWTVTNLLAHKKRKHPDMPLNTYFPPAPVSQVFETEEFGAPSSDPIHQHGMPVSQQQDIFLRELEEVVQPQLQEVVQPQLQEIVQPKLQEVVQLQPQETTEPQLQAVVIPSPQEANIDSDDDADLDFVPPNNSDSETSPDESESKGRKKKKKEKGPFSRRRSMIWRLFNIIDNTFAQCKICTKKLSHRSTNTNLLQHTRRKHPTMYMKFRNNKRDFHHSCNEIIANCQPSASTSVDNTNPSSLPAQNVTISNHEYQFMNPQGMSSYTLPIIFVQDENDPSKTKIQFTDVGRNEALAHPFETPTIITPSKSAPDLKDDRLMAFVEEGNNLLKGMAKALERQSDVLIKLVSCIDALKGRQGQAVEQLLTD